MRDSTPRASLVWPTILIGLGVVILLNNLGLLAWDVWAALVRLWPVLLIAIGLDLLIGRRSPWGSLLVAILLLGAVVGIVWVSARGLPGAARVEQSVRQPLEGADRAEVRIGFGVGTLRLDALDDGDQLLAGTIERYEDERLSQEFSVDGGTARLDLRRRGLSRIPWNAGRSSATWTLSLNPEVPLQLTIDTGVGNSFLDLSGLQVTDLEISAGVGKTTLTLPAAGRVIARVDGGVGEIVVVIPRGVAARIEAQAGLGRMQLPEGFRRDGNVYLSEGYEAAENRVDLEVSGGIGNITVRQGG